MSAHVITAAPWLAADPALAPWPRTPGLDVYQPGAWILPDHRPLPAELTSFLDVGEPPVYFGFGSSRAPEGLTETVVATARALGRRSTTPWAARTRPSRWPTRCAPTERTSPRPDCAKVMN